MPSKPPSRELLKQFFKNHQMIIAYESLFSDGTDFQDQINDLQQEIDRVETGAGLETDGTYIVPTGSNFIDTSVSLANAISLIDQVSGGGAKIVTITGDTSLLSLTQTILADATSGVINITLPNPITFISGGVSRGIGITKIDTTSNFINILPFGSELIVGESSQDLQLDGEVLNFITDGTNWYLGN